MDRALTWNLLQAGINYEVVFAEIKNKRILLQYLS